MNGNVFELLGRVNYVNIKYVESGKAITRVLISIKRYKSEEYDTFPITFFGDMAEAVGEKVKAKEDYIHVTGRINVDKYKTKDGKDVEQLSLIGNSFEKVTFDKSKKQFVAVEEQSTPKTEQQQLLEDMFGG